MRFFDDWKLRRRMRATGQALILIVLTFMGLLLFLGLMVDLGQIFLAKGYLRRAADAGALAAAAQFRENRTIEEMRAAAEEVAHMNGIVPTSILVETCKSVFDETGLKDPKLCPPSADVMPRKKVRVTITLDYPLTFLSLLNIYSVRLVETSISEAAAMDVVLVIDVSESMSWDAPAEAELPYGDDPRDPSVCNSSAGGCHPFQEVKDAALLFAGEVLNKDPGEEEDRLAIVTFASGWQPSNPTDGFLGTSVYMNWTDDYDTVALPSINALSVYDPGIVCPWEAGGKDACAGSGPVQLLDAWCPAAKADIPVGMCRSYDDDGHYHNFGCPRFQETKTEDVINFPPDGVVPAEDNTISACLTTDIGGGLRVAGNQFAVEKRPDALWVVVLLTDGAANTTLGTDEDQGGTDNTKILLPGEFGLDPDKITQNYPFGFCPPGTYEAWGPTSLPTDWQQPHRRFCQDGDADSYHSPMTSGNYDADDFARDQAKFVACAATAEASSASCGTWLGQGAIIFTIGLGKEILMMDNDLVGGQKPYGGSLLRYIAALGDDGDALTVGDPCLSETDYTKSCGNYFYAAGGADLTHVFELIYSRIFTRLTA